MRSVTFVIGLVCCVLFAGCTSTFQPTTFQLPAPETERLRRSLDCFTPEELSTLSASVKKIAGTNSTQLIDSNNIVRVVDGSVVNKFVIPNELRRDAVTFSGVPFHHLNVYTPYACIQYKYSDGGFSLYPVYSYESSDIQSFVDDLCTSRSKEAQKRFVQSRQESPWLANIAGDYEQGAQKRLEIELRDDRCVIICSEKGVKPDFKRHTFSFLDGVRVFRPGRAFSFYGALPSNTIKVALFQNPYCVPDPIMSISERLGSPILTNGFTNIQFRTVSFKDDYSTLVFDGEEYRDRDKYEVFEKKERAVKAAEKARNEKIAREEELLQAPIRKAKLEQAAREEALRVAQMNQARQARQAELLREVEALFAKNDFTEAWRKANKVLPLFADNPSGRDLLIKIQSKVQQKAEQGGTWTKNFNYNVALARVQEEDEYALNSTYGKALSEVYSIFGAKSREDLAAKMEKFRICAGDGSSIAGILSGYLTPEGANRLSQGKMNDNEAKAFASKGYSPSQLANAIWQSTVANPERVLETLQSPGALIERFGRDVFEQAWAREFSDIYNSDRGFNYKSYAYNDLLVRMKEDGAASPAYTVVESALVRLHRNH